ncbi:hypothetical protein ACFO0N_15120 [Halobium salinum]|uniref:Uncharacterized protein n=1 Tax=Halobium salinum TaxID=1364940 RepID=A0ABD5PEF8_9EURY|nr:hypothetical protein [Halobium salinum]
MRFLDWFHNGDDTKDHIPDESKEIVDDKFLRQAFGFDDEQIRERAVSPTGNKVGDQIESEEAENDPCRTSEVDLPEIVGARNQLEQTWNSLESELDGKLDNEGLRSKLRKLDEKGQRFVELREKQEAEAQILRQQYLSDLQQIERALCEVIDVSDGSSSGASTKIVQNLSELNDQLEEALPDNYEEEMDQMQQTIDWAENAKPLYQPEPDR